MNSKITLSFVTISVVLTSYVVATAEPAERAIGPDICKGRVWIKHMAAIQSTSDSADDPMSCYFDPDSKVGKRVLRVCNEYGGSAAHGCWVRGTFVVEGSGARRLIGVVDVRKLNEPGDQ